MIRYCAHAVPLVFAVATTAAAQQPQLPPRDLPRNEISTGKGFIGGIVRAADTGTPLRGVDIRLTGTGARATVRGAFTDAGGRYEFQGLPDGQYTLTASKVRYMTMTYGQTRAGEDGKPVQVSGGQRVDNIDFALPAGGVIVLRVGDRFGDPAVGYRVNLFQAKAGPGQRTLASLSGSIFGNTTDDRGEIRLSGLPPGEYYVSAAASPGAGSPLLAGSGLREQEVQTFYPGTPTDAEAQPIFVGLGDEVVVALNTVVARTARVSGTIVGSGRPQVRMGLRMVGGGLTMVNVNVAGDGSFSATNLFPGEYEMTATADKELGMLRFVVTGDDVGGLVLTMKPVVPLRGRVTFEGAAPIGLAQTSFVFRPAFAETGGAPYVAQIKPDWTFEIPTLSGTGVLRGDLPQGWFLKAVLLDGRDVTDTVLDFQAYQEKTIELIVTQRATEIGGRVTDDAGRAVGNYVAVVFPEEQQRWTPLTRAIASARPDQQGRFSFRGLPPGRYLVAAVDYLQSGQERDPKLLERLRARAVPVALTDGATQNVTVTLLP